jgi:hypothetical protein
MRSAIIRAEPVKVWHPVVAMGEGFTVAHDGRDW